MDTKKWFIATVAVFAVMFGLEYVIHGVLLSDIYQQTASVWRPETEMQQHMWLMWFGYAIFAAVFVWIYTKGYETHKSPLGQGVRYGLLVGLLVATVQSFGWYAVLPIPAALAMWWFVAGLVECLAIGVTASLTYQKTSPFPEKK